MNDKVALSDVLVELHVDDFKIVKDFYIKLGFKIVWECPAKEKSGYLVMKRGKSILCFYCGNKEVYTHSFFSRFPKNTPRSYGIEVGIYVKNIDRFYKNVEQKLGSKFIVKPLMLKPWGKKDFRIIDPFGFYIRFSEPLNILKKKTIKKHQQ